MIAVDTNLLIYALREESPWHQAARACVTDLAEGRGAWAIPWPCVHEFLAIATHPRIFRPATPLALAIDAVEAWMESPGLVLLGENESYWALAGDLLAAGRIAGPQVHDGRIAALCMSHGVSELWSADRDFSRFPGLVCRNPLVA